MVVLELNNGKLKKTGPVAMYFSQTYGSESTLCAGACRRFEAGAEGQ